MEPVTALNGQRSFSKLLFQNVKEGLIKTNTHDYDMLMYLQSLAKHSCVSYRSQTNCLTAGARDGHQHPRNLEE